MAAAPGPSAAAVQGVTEFVIKVPKKNDMRRYSVLKFNEADNVDPSNWTDDSMVRLEREDNKHVVMSSQAVQDYGEGSEYGRAAREEARRKKYGRQAKSYRLDNQPWQLNFVDTDGRERKMNGIREGDGHSDFWVLLKDNNSEFLAYKLDDMHRFVPAITHRTLDIDQAEEKFLQRNKVMNQFALKAQIMSQLKANDEEGEQMEGAKGRSLKIKDEHSSDSEADGDEDEDGGEEKQKKKKKTKKGNDKQRKDKRQRVENADEVAKYESSDGEDEGREYDYMSDSGSESDREQVKVEDKIEKELVGVGDETGLKKMMDSDSDEDSDEEDFTKKLLNRDDSKKKDNMDVEERDSSGSDSDDPDKEKIDSVVFMQKKELAGEAASSSSSSVKKRPASDVVAPGGASEAKKVKTESTTEGLNEETVRKYLRRKPHTTKELLTKIKSKCGDMEKADIVTRLAAILKAIEPHQFKQRQGKKEVLFFSLTNNLA